MCPNLPIKSNSNTITAVTTTITVPIITNTKTITKIGIITVTSTLITTELLLLPDINQKYGKQVKSKRCL